MQNQEKKVLFPVVWFVRLNELAEGLEKLVNQSEHDQSHTNQINSKIYQLLGYISSSKDL